LGVDKDKRATNSPTRWCVEVLRDRRQSNLFGSDNLDVEQAGAAKDE
jgi:hypothetical protein